MVLPHPSLPARPTTSYQSQPTSNRPPVNHSAPPVPPIPLASTPLSLPNRPNPPPLSSLSNSTSSSRPPLNASTSSFIGAAASPRLSASSASSQAGKEYAAGVAGDLAWPRVRGKLTPEEVKVDSELIELGSGWTVRYKCWKGAAIPLGSTTSTTTTSSDPTLDPNGYDPFVPANFSTSHVNPTASSSSATTTATTSNTAKGKEKEEEGPPKKKPRPLNAFDQLLAEEMGTLSSPLAGPPSLPPTPLPKYQPVVRTDASTSKLDDQLETLRSSRTFGTMEDPFERARRDLIRRGKEKVEEGGDRLDLMSFVKVASTQLVSKKAQVDEEVQGKGKGKEKETEPVSTETKVEAAGRTLWAFCVIRGGDSEPPKTVLDDLEYDELTCVASGSFDHRQLYPALYPPSSASNPNLNPNLAGSSPLSRSAQYYPSALALSANLLTSSTLRTTQVGIAHRAFLAAVEDALMSEIIATSHSEGTPRSEKKTWLRLGNSLALLPPASSFSPHLDAFDSTASPTSPRKRLQPSPSLSTFRTTLQRSTIFVQTRIEELPYRPLPLRPSPDSPMSDYPILLAPLGLKARVCRRIRSDAWKGCEEEVNELREKWRNQLDAAHYEIEGNDWIVCQLDLASSEGEGEGGHAEGKELVWPTELVVLDGTRPPPPPSQSSPDKTPHTHLRADDTLAPQSSHLSVTSPDAKFPPPPATTPDITLLKARPRPGQLLPSPYDSMTRRRLAEKAFGRSRRRSQARDVDEKPKLPEDPLARRTNEIWSWMEEEATRKEKDAAEALMKEQKEKEEEEEQKRLEEAEKDRKKSNSRNPPPVTAPINMRTPMSLGTSSTEAPSPADFVYPLPGYTNPLPASTAHEVSFTTPTTTGGPHKRSDHMEIDGLGLGLYPSPEEAPHHSVQAPVQQHVAPTSQPMSSLDNAFASFDWGDGSYGTSGAQNGEGGAAASHQDYDDGMDLLGLTDDDFSFFDTAPTPAPGAALASANDMSLSIAQDPFAMSHSTTTSPKFVDHFSHLSAPPFAPSGSLTSPYSVQTSPQFALHGSPVATAMSTHFQFDPPSNSLGLGAPPTSHSLVPVHQDSPPESVSSPDVDVAALVVPSFAVDLSEPSRSTSHVPMSPSPRRSRRPLPGAFEPIAFGPSYTFAADKYDSRKGKFGLPSPDSDNEDDPRSSHRLSIDHILPRPTTSSLEPWYSGICDPRRAVAERLQRDRRSKEEKSRNVSRGRGRAISRGPMKDRGWKRAISRGEDGSDGTATADEESGDGSDMEVEEAEHDDGRKNADDGKGTSGEYRDLFESGGVELFALGDFAASLVKRPTAPVSPPSVPLATLQSLEVLLILLVEQNLVNPASRILFHSAQQEKVPRLLSTFAIREVSDSLSSVCSALSPSPLFADHTLLPTLEIATSPSLLLRSQQTMVQVSTSAIEFWKPMGFEPVIGRKDVTVFAVYEEGGATMRDLVAQWLRIMALTYQGLRLGEQSTGTLPASAQFGGTQDGHIALPSGSLGRGLSKQDSKALSTAMCDIPKLYQNAVLFVFTPEGKEPFSTSSPLFTLLHLLQRNKPPVSTIVSCPIPISHLYRDDTIRSWTGTDRFTANAFSLFDQIQVPVARLRFPVSETFPSAAAAPNPANQSPSIRLFQSPAIKLAPVRPRKIGFDMNFPVSTLAVQQRHRFLHVCYTSSPANPDGTSDWIHLASIDDTGETWRSVNRLIKTPSGVAGDVMRARLVWQLILQLLVAVDVEWRIVICRLDEPSVVEIRAWESMLKDQLTGIRRPLHASFVYVDLNPPLAVQPCIAKIRRASVQSDAISEEGELDLVSRPNAGPATKSEPLFDTEPTILAFTPSEPVNVLPSVTLFAPASTYVIHVPRIPTFTHTTVDSSAPLSVSPSPISIYGIHFLLSHASRTSSYTATLSDFVKDVRQSYAELAALAKARWHMNGRLPWHLEAVRLAKDVADTLGERSTE